MKFRTAVAFAALVGAARVAAAQTNCVPFHVRLDPSIANTSRPADLGSSVCHTFLAEDTLIARITVWLPPNFPSSIGAHLYVTATDANGRPDVSQILLDGPTIHVGDSDPPGQFIEMPFVLNPPLVLPFPGTYAFFLRTEFCSPASWYIVANNTNPYPYGLYWLTGRVDSSPCRLRPVVGGENNTDLLFDIEFCGTRITSVHQGTWGTLKTIDR
jgi:hypothetical protein